MKIKYRSIISSLVAAMVVSFSLAYAEEYFEVQDDQEEVAARDGAPSLYDTNRDRMQQESRQRRSSYYTQDEYYYSSPDGYNSNPQVNTNQNQNQNNGMNGSSQSNYYLQDRQQQQQQQKRQSYRGPINPELRR
jgi:hypothetical protein